MMKRYIFSREKLLSDPGIHSKEMARLWSRDAEGCEVTFPKYEPDAEWGKMTDTTGCLLKAHRLWCDVVEEEEK